LFCSDNYQNKQNFLKERKKKSAQSAEKELTTFSSLIYRALLKYGYSNFSLEILEYCEEKDLLAREQYYLDTLKPEYNLLKIAGSWAGYKHSDETLAKMKGRVKSIELRARMVIAQPNVNAVKITDLKTGITTNYDSLRQAAISVNMHHATLRYYVKNNKPYKIFFAEYSVSPKK
jgi:hypothetical protein